MALVTLLARHYKALKEGHKTRLHAFIVDHKLRDNSTEEAEFVAKQVQKLDWSATNNPATLDSSEGSLTTATHKPDKIHLETKARLERYKAIAFQCQILQIKDLFVGHHSGDQVETVLFRFSRASGIDGLAGIQGVAPLGVLNVVEARDIKVLRPLLNVTKERLRATCEETGTLWVEDPSNRSLDYQRNVIRHYQHGIDAQILQDPQSSEAMATGRLVRFGKWRLSCQTANGLNSRTIGFNSVI
ncbi:hypothetical protein BGZ65_003880 [Modicella reniformis]|uniref:tRNA(Ile)-lysidine synthetase n=1 Tax=Modicella reniformis TaxID=1440133 RepID=A0A9P6INZ5_9FUNG|nr:hypothetical protein BGZ65_003880 [Modicella reniformis]